jgi:hypothetical protein
LYNAIFGYNEFALEILAVLELKPQDFERFRDAFVTNGEIAVYTRLGGGNREGYAETIEKLQKHPLYLRDKDDSYDSTYATFYFRIPDQYRELMKRCDIGEFSPEDRWKQAMENLKRPGETDRVLGRLPQFTKAIGIDPKGEA